MQTHAISIDSLNCITEKKFGSTRLRLVYKKLRRTRRIDHAVARDTQPANQTFSQARFSLPQRVGIENLNYDTALGIEPRLAPRFRHLFVVSGDPDRATRIVFNFARQLSADLIPKLLRITCKRKLRLGIVHHNEMAHARRSGATADYSRFDDRDTQSFARTLRRARGSDNARADDHYVTNFNSGHLGMPIANGSRSSIIKLVSAVMNAEPLIRGWTTLSITFTRPSKTLPTMLSCRHT